MILAVGFILSGCDPRPTTPQAAPPLQLVEEVHSVEPTSDIAKSFFRKGKGKSMSGMRSRFKTRNLEIMTVNVKDKPPVSVLIAPVAQEFAQVRSIHEAQKENGAADSMSVTESYFYHEPTHDITFRVDFAYQSKEKQRGLARFVVPNIGRSMVFKVRKGKLTQMIRTTNEPSPRGSSSSEKRLSFASVQKDDWTTAKCIETSAEGCLADAECGFLCGAMLKYCAAAVTISCAVSANN